MGYKVKSQKQLQTGEQIKREIAGIFIKEDLFKKNNFKLTVCEADVSPDLKNAKIYINIFGDIDEKKLIAELNANNYYFQRLLSRSVKLKNTPKIFFILDNSSSVGVKIAGVIDKEKDSN